MSTFSVILFECYICCGQYNSTTRRPLIGLCGHTMCEVCRAQWKSGCPICLKSKAFTITVLNRQLLDAVEQFDGRSDISCKKSDDRSEVDTKETGINRSEHGVFCEENTSSSSDCTHLVMQLTKLCKEFQSTFGEVNDSFQCTENLLNDILKSSEVMPAEKYREEIKIGVGEISMMYDLMSDIARKVKTTNNILEHRLNQIGSQNRITQPIVEENDYAVVIADKCATINKNTISIGVFDTKEATWTSLGKLSSTNYSYCVASHGQAVYIVGGYSNLCHLYQNTLEMYSMKDKLQKVCSPMEHRRRSTSAAFYKGKLYVCGGYDGTYLDIVEIYDPVTDQWTAGPVLNCKRANSALVVFENQLYAIGGHNGTEYEKRIERLNESEDRFDVVGQMVKGRSGFGCCSWNGRVYIAGGWDLHNTTLNTVESYNPKENNWRDETPMNHKRKYVTLVTSMNALLAIRGYDDSWNIHSSIEQLHATSQRWLTKPCLSASSHFEGASKH